MSTTSEMIRKMFREGDDIRDAGLRSPDDIVRWDNILYGIDSEWQILDVYRPRAENGKKLPVIVSVHGGGWVYGDKERYQFYCMNLAQRGFAVVNYSYRLAPESKFPASLEDTNLVFSWVLAHGEEYGFDLKHVFGVGDSAGAHILGLYTCICTNTEYADQFPFHAPLGFVPSAIALNCGAYLLEANRSVPDLTTCLMEDFLPGHGTSAELERITVTNHILPNFPPVFLMTATGDFMMAQAPILAKKLAETAIPFVYRFYGDSTHELGHVFHLNIRSKNARVCNDEECAFFLTVCREDR